MQLFNISHNPPCGICANGTVVMLRGSKSEPVLCNPWIHLVAQYWQTNCRGVIYRHKPRPIFLCLKRFCTNLLLLLSFVHVSVSIFRYALSHTQTQSRLNCQHSSSPSQTPPVVHSSDIRPTAATVGNCCYQFYSNYVIAHVVFQEEWHKSLDVWDVVNGTEPWACAATFLFIHSKGMMAGRLLNRFIKPQSVKPIFQYSLL